MAKKPDETITLPPGAQAPTAGPRPGAQAGATYRYIDRPECMETFADSITGLSYDGQSLRIEFSVSRADEMKPNINTP